jgi:hypothetical protein
MEWLTQACVTNSSRPLANLKGKENLDLSSVCSNYWPPIVALSLCFNHLVLSTFRQCRSAIPQIGLNRTSHPAPVVREFSNVRIPDFRFFSFPDSERLKLLKFLFSRWCFLVVTDKTCLLVLSPSSFKIGTFDLQLYY